MSDYYLVAVLAVIGGVIGGLIGKSKNYPKPWISALVGGGGAVAGFLLLVLFWGNRYGVALVLSPVIGAVIGWVAVSKIGEKRNVEPGRIWQIVGAVIGGGILLYAYFSIFFLPIIF